jgi:MATE family multidrug resistance protein
MVGRLGPEPLSAVALGNSISFTVLIACFGALLALDPMVSQAFGAKRYKDCGKTLDHAVVLALLLSIPTMILLSQAHPLLQLLRQTPELSRAAADYIHAILYSVVPFLMFTVMRQFLQGISRPRPAMTIVILANGLNIFANWVLIYGNLGASPMGSTGAAWATTLCRFAMFLGLLLWLVTRKSLKRYAIHLWPRPIETQLLVRMASLGFPVGLQYGMEIGVFASTSVMMGWLGTVQLAGHQIALSLVSTTFMVPLGLSSTAAVRVGQALGRGDALAARRAAFVAYGLGMLFLAFAASCFFLVPEVLARIFTSDAELIAMAATLLGIGAIFQLSDGTQTIAIGALRGAADTRMSMIVAFIAYWLIGLPLGWALAFPLGFGAVGLWWGLTTGLTLVGIVLAIRFHLLVRPENSRRLQALG